jgi:hypothetical protein
MSIYTLAERDIYLQKVDEQINLRKELLIEKKIKLEKKLQVNSYLEGVKINYQDYYDKFLNEFTLENYNNSIDEHYCFKND